MWDSGEGGWTSWFFLRSCHLVRVTARWGGGAARWAGAAGVLQAGWRQTEKVNQRWQTMIHSLTKEAEWLWPLLIHFVFDQSTESFVRVTDLLLV